MGCLQLDDMPAQKIQNSQKSHKHMLPPLLLPSLEVNQSTSSQVYAMLIISHFSPAHTSLRIRHMPRHHTDSLPQSRDKQSAHTVIDPHMHQLVGIVGMAKVVPGTAGKHLTPGPCKRHRQCMDACRLACMNADIKSSALPIAMATVRMHRNQSSNHARWYTNVQTRQTSTCATYE